MVAVSRVRFVLPAPLGGPCSSHILGKRGVAVEVPGNLGRGLSAVFAGHRARVVCRAGLLNVVV
jgi:hypothetical protein